MRSCPASINTIDSAFNSPLSKAIVGMQQSLGLWRTNNPSNIFISIVGTPAHISKLHTSNGVKKQILKQDRIQFGGLIL
jgi:hypothetical protein